MKSLDFGGLPEGALLLIDLAPIIYVLEDHPKFASRFEPLFEAHAAGRLQFAVTTVTIAEVLTGPMKASDEALAQRYRAILNRGGRSPSMWTSPKARRDCERRCDWAWPTLSRPRARWRSTPRRLSLTTAIFARAIAAGYVVRIRRSLDFVSRTTPTDGSEPDFLKNIMGGLFRFS